MVFKLRKWCTGDVESLALHANNLNIAKYMADAFPHPYSTQDARDYIAMATHHNPPHIFAIEADGQAVGSIGLHIQKDINRKNAELGYWLAESYWGRGIASRAVKEMVKYGFEHFDILRIFARPFPDNIASKIVLEKNGFRLEAKIENGLYKNGTLLDELIYALRK